MPTTPRNLSGEPGCGSDRDSNRTQAEVACPVCGEAVIPRARCGAGWVDEVIHAKSTTIVTAWYACPHCRTPLRLMEENDG